MICFSPWVRLQPVIKHRKKESDSRFPNKKRRRREWAPDSKELFLTHPQRLSYEFDKVLLLDLLHMVNFQYYN